ncbi:MAG: hypothetical protein ACTSV2_17045 [Candidatus Thorarchaeota archaeon]
MKRVTPLLLVTLFLAGLFIAPVGMQSVNGSPNETTIQIENEIFEPTGILDKEFRVALFNTTNSTKPGYVSGGINLNNTEFYDVLVAAGYQVTRITLQDIQNKELLTANYDVLVLSDLCPPENITELVKDFWEGGGGILSLDTAIEYLGYAGILPRESIGDNGEAIYWDYVNNDIGVINERHPVTKSYNQDEEINYFNANFAMYDWSAMVATSNGADYVALAHDNDSTNGVIALAADAQDMGGKVVQIGIPGNLGSPDWHDMIIDAVEWLTPVPKARIAFDFTHNPYYGVDTGDPSRYFSGDRFADLRDALVTRSYTFDKLFMSTEGNLTPERLAPYDLLIINTPGINFTVSEIAAVNTWVAGGGGLLLMGEATTFNNDNFNLNYLMRDFDIKINTTQSYSPTTIITTEKIIHPLTEGTTTVEFSGGTYINTTGNAVAIWCQLDNILAGAQQIGQGRVVLIGDINLLGSALANSDNERFGINIANWLTSGDAEVLLFVNEPDSPNYYRTPVSLALNDLGISNHLTFTQTYFNISLNIQSWNLVIVDVPWFLITIDFYEEIAEYVEAGGRLLMSTYTVDNFPDTRLWPLLGFNFSDDMPDTVPVHIWDAGHGIFNIPNDYGAGNFTPIRDYNDEGDLLNVFDNATSLAGLSATVDSSESIIVLRDDGQTLYNGYLIDQFTGDFDDSTYPDNFELWENQIAFMMRPTIDSPTDIEYEVGDTGNELTWISDSEIPFEYTITLDTTEIENAAWDGSNILVNVDGLDVGNYTYEVTVFDTAGYSTTDIVIVSVLPGPETTTDVPPPLDLTMIMLIVIVAIAGLVIVIIIMKKKK